ncbi:MAG TPA: hypothetical protein VLN57_02215 [Xanthobacteraceae bacterium]|jgi:hypothetical protein|nr:hypothetical protein [Xanthobacteraceae bacterium]
MAAAFGAGMGCVLVVVGPWKHVTDLAAKLAPATQSASPDLQVMSVEAASANTATQTVSPSVPVAPLDLDGTPAGASKATEQPMPRARPADAPAPGEKSATAKSPDTKAGETKATNGKASNTKGANPTGAETSNPGARTPANTRNSAKAASQGDQPTGMVQVDEEELPDGRRVPVYRRPTIFDGVRTSGSQ